MCSETSAHKIQTPGNHSTERQHSEHDESLKSKVVFGVGSTSSDGLLSDDRTFRVILYIQISFVACRKLKTGLRVVVTPGSGLLSIYRHPRRCREAQVRLLETVYKAICTLVEACEVCVVSRHRCAHVTKQSVLESFLRRTMT